MKTILFFGDSITDTYRSRENDSNFGMGYPTLVKGEITFDYPNQYILYNRGIAGNRVVDLYARVKQDVINLKPDVVSILIGVNDAWHELTCQNGVETGNYSKVYSMLIEEIMEALPDVKIMIMEPFLLEGVSTENTETFANRWNLFSTEVKKRAVEAKEIAEKYNLPFIPLQDKFDEATKLAANSYWLYDGEHPTTAGHELIKREWIKAFKKLF